jgi:hypothetical protein
MERDKWTNVANAMSLEELCSAIYDNLTAHGYGSDKNGSDLIEILTYIRIYYERYNANLSGLLVDGVEVDTFNRAWLSTTPIDEERS